MAGEEGNGIIYVTANLPHGTDEAFIVPEIGQMNQSRHGTVIPRWPRGPDRTWGRPSARLGGDLVRVKSCEPPQMALGGPC
jgi:hypothetical protein